LFGLRIATGPDGSAQGLLHVFGEEQSRSMTDVIRREAEFSLCLVTGNDQRGLILQPGDAT